MFKYLSKKRSLPWIVGLSLLVIVVCLWYRLWTGAQVLTRQFIAQEVLEITETFNRQLSTRVSILERMSRHWQVHQRIYGVLSQQDWQHDAQSYYENYPGYGAIAHINTQGKADWTIPKNIQLSRDFFRESLNNLFIGKDAAAIIKLVTADIKGVNPSQNSNKLPEQKSGEISREISKNSSEKLLKKQILHQDLAIFVPLGELGDRQEEILVGVLKIPDFFDHIFKSPIVKGVGIQVFFNNQEIYHHPNPSISSFINESGNESSNQSRNQSRNQFVNQSSNQANNQANNQVNNQGLRNQTSISFKSNLYDTEWQVYLSFPKRFGQQGGVFLPWIILFGGIILAIGLGGLIYLAQTAYQKTQKISQINHDLQIEIQQRQLAELDLRKQQEVLQAVFEHIPIMLALYDNQGVVQQVNPELVQVMGWSLEDYRELDVLAIAYPDPILYQQIMAHMIGATGQWLDVVAITKHGQTIDTSWVNILLSNGNRLGIGQDITERKRLEKLLLQKIQQEKALRKVVGSIRNSLDLNQTFTTAATAIAHLLTTDRADIVEYRPQEGFWLTVASYRHELTMADTLGSKIPDQDNTVAARLKKLEVVRLGDAVQAEDEINRELARSFPGAWLLIPLHVRGVVWGSLSLARHTRLNSWSDLDEELAISVAEQLAIAIQQSQLHQQLQAFNTSLERQVHLHTLELQRALSFEATLKRITDKVRDSLDQNQILQTVVKELLETLEVDCCNAVLYNNPAKGSVNSNLENSNPVNALANPLTNGLTNSLTNSSYGLTPNLDRSHTPLQFQATIAYEATQVGVSSHFGNNLFMADLPDIYHQLQQGQYTAFCLLNSSFIRHDFAMLTCPIIDDHGLLGDLWLFKPPLSSFGEMEIRLLEQVANQCAIAIRQAQLYQAAQKQVTELERLNFLKDDFLSTISHELRTPISSIKIATDMIEILIDNLGGFQGDLKVLETYIQILHGESQREEKLINDLLDLTRLESGTEPLSLTPIKLQYWIPYITDTFVERAKSQQQQLFIEIPPDFPEITTDVSILERIIVELLNNACKYTPAGEFILFTATIEQFSSQEQPHVQISVVNSGVEIPSEELERIFDKFYRIPNRDPWRYGGTGLGLALVRRLAQYLGATIEVESDFGRTCFTVDLGKLYPEEPE